MGERRVEGRLAEGDLAGAVAAARQSLAAAEGAAAVRYWRERLAQLLLRSGEEGEALALRTANFAEEADLESYRRLREAALRLGRWPEVAPGARAALRRRAGRAALVQALAEEGEADQLAEELGAALAEKTDLPWEPALRALLWLGRREPERAAALGAELLRRSGGEAGQQERLRRALRRMRPGRARGPA
ncbi:MAG: hypothetical protein IRZ26_08615 [Clostridia bacterium]|nr:hypothetical protein [Clostridia bacterium]